MPFLLSVVWAGGRESRWGSTCRLRVRRQRVAGSSGRSAASPVAYFEIRTGRAPRAHRVRSITDAHDLETVELAVVKGEVGAVENAAIWVSEKNLLHRVLPFITQHLIIILEKANLVPNMHEAYRKIDITQSGYGVFIAGPSKTADIEQSLVIGAHGSRSLTVFLI